jgi:hypothetical protein
MTEQKIKVTGNPKKIIRNRIRNSLIIMLLFFIFFVAMPRLEKISTELSIAIAGLVFLLVIVWPLIYWLNLKLVVIFVAHDLPNIIMGKWSCVIGKPCDINCYHVPAKFLNNKINQDGSWGWLFKTEIACNYSIGGVEFMDMKELDWDKTYKITYLPHSKIIIKIEVVK